MGLRKQISFSALGSIGTRAGQFIAFIILARLLSPDEFGLLAMLNVLGAFAMIFIDMGLGAALIHNRNASAIHYSSAFALNLSLGVVFYFLMFFLSGQIAIFFDEPALSTLSKVFSSIFLLNAIGVVPMSILQKSGNFHLISAAELSSMFIASVIGITLATKGFGPWALIWWKLSSSGLRSLLFLSLSKWKPAIKVKKDEIVELWRYLRYLIGSRILNYAVQNLDDLLVGKIAGSANIGLYNTSYRIMTLPRNLSGSIINRVMLSKYASLQINLPAIKAYHLRISRLIALLTFPVNFAVIVIADHLVLNIFGAQWEQMVFILQLFAIRTLWAPIGALNSAIYLSLGATKRQLNAGLIVNGVAILSIVIGAFWGMYGILYGFVIAVFINFYPSFYFSGSLIGLKVYEVILNFIPVLIPASISSIIVYTFKYFFINKITIVNMVFLCIMFFLIYAFIAYLVNKQTIKLALSRS